MIPVELRLQNFLSYGENAPALDFTAFAVACISGGNGQGKSTLLDAITWALWGQARKSSASVKPDAELMRTGARRMSVEFTFEHDGGRYRVKRAYNLSASGKTPKPELELFALEDEAGTYRALTGTNVSDTQRILDRTLKIDYDTFINASFLVQGRADEFTRKKPTERKDVLARILNLGRYEDLERRAAERERGARDVLAVAEAEIGRLDEGLAGVPAVEADHADATARLVSAREHLARCAKAADDARERLARLDARARELGGLRERLAALDADRATVEAERAGLSERIARADRVVGQREAIVGAFARYEALCRERDELFQKSGVARGLEDQLRKIERESDERVADHARKVGAVESERQHVAESVADVAARLDQRGSLEAALASARQSALDAAGLGEKRRARALHETSLREIEGRIRVHAGQLEADARNFERGVQEVRTALADPDVLARNRSRLLAENERRDALGARLETLKQDGTDLGARVAERRMHASRHAEDAAGFGLKLDRLADAPDGGDCPTCGTALTPAHRRRVEADLRRSLDASERAAAAETAEADRLDRDLSALRAAFKTEREAFQLLGHAPGDLIRVDEQARNYARDVEQLTRLEASYAAHRRTLDAGDFLHDDRRLLTAVRRALDETPFDEALFDRLQRDAAQAERYEASLRDLDRAALRRDELAERTRVLAARLDALRRDLDGGALLGDLPARRSAVEGQIARLGFDGVRLSDVLAETERLEPAREQHAELLTVQDHRAAWIEERATRTERLAAVDAERTGLQLRLDGAGTLADETAAAHAERAHAAARAAEAQGDVEALGHRLGSLQSLLDAAKRDRARRAECKRHADVARDEGALYKHLRAAFSRKGIPSLIIEETLPEIEARANNLLDRLSDGQMNVQLRTLRDKKTGGTAETLEIVIADEQGASRPYETFSGGEAFRVNFALRVALSQLLASRTGVSIRTLVIDEGFGTQDPQGVQSLIEAIHEVQSDFDKILVITHLEAMKEAFPVRIEVRKDPVDGSTFEIIGA